MGNDSVRADVAAIRWLCGRGPGMSTEDAIRVVIATHVIEENPLWNDGRVDREVTRRLNEARPAGPAREENGGSEDGHVARSDRRP